MADNGEIQAHEATYHGFLNLLKWGTIGCAVIAIIVILLIAK